MNNRFGIVSGRSKLTYRFLHYFWQRSCFHIIPADLLSI